MSRTSSEPTWWRIAAATGPRMPNVAESIATALNPKAKPMMFWRMIATVLRDSSTRSGRTRSGSPRMIMSPASAARSAPMPPRAMPASACGQRRGVVDAVADHGDLPPGRRAAPRSSGPCRPAAAPRRRCRRGPAWRPPARPARGRRSGSRSRLIFRCRRSWITSCASRPDRVVDADHAGDRAVDRDDQRGLALRVELAQRVPRRPRLERDPVLGEESPVADQDAMRGSPLGPVHRAWTPAPGSTVASIGLEQLERPALRPPRRRRRPGDGGWRPRPRPPGAAPRPRRSDPPSGDQARELGPAPWSAFRSCRRRTCRTRPGSRGPSPP